MKVVVVDRLEIIECFHVKGRGSGTLVSLRADDHASFTVSLGGSRNPSPGGPAVLAYLDRDMKTLHAWLDPVSDEYFVADMHMPSASFLASILVALIALGAVALLGLDPRFMGVVILCLIAGSGIAFVRQRVTNRRLESVLRAALAATGMKPG